MKRALVAIGVVVAVLAGLGVAGGLVPRTLAYRYTASDVAWLFDGDHDYQVMSPRHREIWIAPDGSGRLREEWQAPVFFGERDRAAWAGDRSLPRVLDETAHAGDLIFVRLESVPRDPRTLRSYLWTRAREHLGPDASAVDMLREARSLLWETVPPRDLSGAVLVALSGEPQLESKPGSDRLGRHGLIISASSSGNHRRTYAITLDAGTGALLYEEEVLLDPDPAIDAAPPVVVGWAVYTAATEVSSTTAAQQGVRAAVATRDTTRFEEWSRLGFGAARPPAGSRSSCRASLRVRARLLRQADRAG